MSLDSYCRLGVNIDHVATIRNARGHRHPEPLRAALMAVEAGADGITAHLREDRRHISDQDIDRLCRHLPVPLNLEIAATPEMLEIACRTRPKAVCLVPEKRQERTTEGGLDVAGQAPALAPFIQRLGDYGMRVSLFIAPDPAQVQAAAFLGVPVVELHTGPYCDAAAAEGRSAELTRLKNAAALAESLGLECHAGHGLSYDTVRAVAAIPQIQELNIGHFLIGEAIFTGLAASITAMRRCIDTARG